MIMTAINSLCDYCLRNSCDFESSWAPALAAEKASVSSAIAAPQH